MTTWRYKISLLVLKNISRVSAVKTQERKFGIPMDHAISLIYQPCCCFFVCRWLYLLQRCDNHHIIMDPGDRASSPESSIDTDGAQYGNPVRTV